MAGAYETLFEPVTATAGISATTTSARVSIGSADTSREYPRIVEIGTRTGDADVFIKFGDSSVAATVAGGPIIPGGQVRGFRVPSTATHVAAITASGTATVNVVVGRGF